MYHDSALLRQPIGGCNSQPTMQALHPKAGTVAGFDYVGRPAPPTSSTEGLAPVAYALAPNEVE
jgi:hypothetical protein